MGGLFGPPPPPALPALPAPPVDNSAAEEKARRLEALDRQRRGRSGTVATSPRGVLQPQGSASVRKQRLGE